MKHSFDVEIARKYDIPTAVLLENLFFWIEKNKANNRHFHDGHYWTYNSIKAFVDLFPYLTERQIRYTLQKMIDNKLIITGNYNESQYDRTLWYAITDFGYCILQNCQMDNTKDKNDGKSEENPDNSHFTKLSNGISSSVRPIPDNKPNINNNDKLINDKSRESRACEDESSMPFKNGELMDEENDEKNNTMPTHRKTPTKYPSNDTSYEARHEMREMVSERGLDPFTYQQLHHLVQKLYYDKVFTPEECLVLSDKLNELDKEHWYMTVAKAFSYSLDKSKSKKIKSRVGYLLKIIEKNVEQIEYNESGEPERKADELRKTFENIKNGKLATSS